MSSTPRFRSGKKKSLEQITAELSMTNGLATSLLTDQTPPHEEIAAYEHVIGMMKKWRTGFVQQHSLNDRSTWTTSCIQCVEQLNALVADYSTDTPLQRTMLESCQYQGLILQEMWNYLCVERMMSILKCVHKECTLPRCLVTILKRIISSKDPKLEEQFRWLHPKPHNIHRMLLTVLDLSYCKCTRSTGLDEDKYREIVVDEKLKVHNIYCPEVKFQPGFEVKPNNVKRKHIDYGPVKKAAKALEKSARVKIGLGEMQQLEILLRQAQRKTRENERGHKIKRKEFQIQRQLTRDAVNADKDVTLHVFMGIDDDKLATAITDAAGIVADKFDGVTQTIAANAGITTDKFAQLADVLGGTAERIGDNIGILTEQMRSTCELARTAGRSMKDGIFLIVAVVTGCMAIYYYRHNKMTSTILAGLTATCAYLGCETLLEAARSFAEPAVPHASGADFFPFLGVIAKFAAKLGIQVATTTVVCNTFWNVMKDFLKTKKLITGLKPVLDFFGNWFLSGNIFAADAANPSVLEKDCSDWLDRTVQSFARGDNVSVTMSAARAKDLVTMMTEGQLLSKRVALVADVANLRSLSQKMTSTLSLFISTYHAATRALSAGMTRIEPVAIFIAGPPGIGKSHLLISMSLHLLTVIKNRPCSKEDIYERNLVDKFLSGYVGQLIYVHDDMWCTRNEEDIRETNKEILACNNEMRHRPNMPDLNAKGTTNFISQFNFYTSNVRSGVQTVGIRHQTIQQRIDSEHKAQEDWNEELMQRYQNDDDRQIAASMAEYTDLMNIPDLKLGMVDFGAIVRRFTFIVCPIVKKEYRQAIGHKIDPDKAAKQPVAGKCYIYRVKIQRTTGEVVHEALEYEELFDMIIAEGRRKEIHFKRTTDNLPTLKERLVLKAESGLDYDYHPNYDANLHHLRMEGIVGLDDDDTFTREVHQALTDKYNRVQMPEEVPDAPDNTFRDAMFGVSATLRQQIERWRADFPTAPPVADIMENMRRKFFGFASKTKLNLQPTGLEAMTGTDPNAPVFTMHARTKSPPKKSEEEPEQMPSTSQEPDWQREKKEILSSWSQLTEPVKAHLLLRYSWLKSALVDNKYITEAKTIIDNARTETRVYLETLGAEFQQKGPQFVEMMYEKCKPSLEVLRDILVVIGAFSALSMISTILGSFFGHFAWCDCRECEQKFRRTHEYHDGDPTEMTSKEYRRYEWGMDKVREGKWANTWLMGHSSTGSGKRSQGTRGNRSHEFRTRPDYETRFIGRNFHAKDDEYVFESEKQRDDPRVKEIKRRVVSLTAANAANKTKQAYGVLFRNNYVATVGHFLESAEKMKPDRFIIDFDGKRIVLNYDLVKSVMVRGTEKAIYYLPGIHDKYGIKNFDQVSDITRYFIKDEVLEACDAVEIQDYFSNASFRRYESDEHGVKQEYAFDMINIGLSVIRDDKNDFMNDIVIHGKTYGGPGASGAPLVFFKGADITILGLHDYGLCDDATATTYHPLDAGAIFFTQEDLNKFVDYCERNLAEPTNHAIDGEIVASIVVDDPVDYETDEEYEKKYAIAKTNEGDDDNDVELVDAHKLYHTWRIGSTDSTFVEKMMVIPFNKRLNLLFGGDLLREEHNYFNFRMGDPIYAFLDGMRRNSPGMPISIGLCDGSNSVRCATKSKVRPTPIGLCITIPHPFQEGEFKHKKMPANLVPDWKKNHLPLIEGSTKGGQPMIEFDPRIEAAALEHVKMGFLARIGKNRTQRARWIKDAIHGDCERDYMRSLEMKTSAGPPYTLHGWINANDTTGKLLVPSAHRRFYDGKRKPDLLFKGIEDDGTPKISPLVEKRIREYMRMYKRDKTEFLAALPVVDTLKDELRALEKVNDPRIFTVCGLDFTIMVRIVYLEAIQYMLENAGHWDSCIGINPYNQSEWRRVWNQFTNGGRNKNYIALDYSKFDKIMPSKYILMVLDVLDAFNDRVPVVPRHASSTEKADSNSGASWNEDIEGYLSVRDELREMIRFWFPNFVHVNDHFVYVCPRSNPSGNPLTTIINTIVNAIWIRCAYIEAGIEHGTIDIDNIKMSDIHLKSAEYGDDLLASVDEVDKWFNQKVVLKTMRKHNVKMTDGSKGTSDENEIDDFVRKEDIRFLKREFHEDEDGNLLARKDLDDIITISLWLREKNPTALSLSGLYNTCLREMALHGHEKFCKFRNWLVTMMTRTGTIVPINTWADAIRELKLEASLKDNVFMSRDKEVVPHSRDGNLGFDCIIDEVVDRQSHQAGTFNSVLRPATSIDDSINLATEKNGMLDQIVNNPTLQITAQTTQTYGNLTFDVNSSGGGSGGGDVTWAELNPALTTIQTSLTTISTSLTTMITLLQDIKSGTGNNTLVDIRANTSSINSGIGVLKTALVGGLSPSNDTNIMTSLIGPTLPPDATRNIAAYLVGVDSRQTNVPASVSLKNALVGGNGFTTGTGTTGNSVTAWLNSAADRILNVQRSLIGTDGQIPNSNNSVLGYIKDPICPVPITYAKPGANAMTYSWAERVSFTDADRSGNSIPFVANVPLYTDSYIGNQTPIAGSAFQPGRQNGGKQLVHETPVSVTLHSASGNLMDPVGVDSTTERAELTTFEQPPTIDTDMPENNVKKVDSNIPQSLFNFLKRFHLLKILQWNKNLAQGKYLTVFDPFRELLARDVIRDKLRGFKYIKANVEIKIITTGNMFMSGMLVAYHVPPNRIGECNAFESLVHISGMPHQVEIFPTENGEYKLTVPIYITQRWLDMENANIGWEDVLPAKIDGSASVNQDFLTLGLVKVVVFAPLYTEDGVDSANLSIYAALRNIELGQYYTDKIMPKPSVSIPTQFTDVDATPDMSQMQHTVHQMRRAAITNTIPTTYTLHLKITEEGTESYQHAKKPEYKTDEPRDNASTERERKETTGVLTNALRSVMLMARVLSPIYGPIMNGIALMAGGLSIVTDAFNLDKPHIRHAPRRVLNDWKDLTHGDGLAESRHVGLTVDNQVSPFGATQPGGLGDMSFGPLCATPQLLGSLTIGTDVVSDTSIFRWAVAPWNVTTSMIRKVGPNQANSAQALVNHTFASYIANCFQYWRGVARVTIKVVAQGPAKMVLGCRWVPGDGEAAFDGNMYARSALDLTDFGEVENKIIQVSSNTQEEFVIPFGNQSYFLNCDTTLLPHTGTSSPDVQGTNGVFEIYVVNPLSSFSPTGSLANPVTILVYVSWDQIDFARPSVANIMNVGPALLSSLITEEEKVKYTLHSKDSDHLFGESITHALPLIRRLGFAGYHNQVVAPTSDRNTTIHSIFYSSPFTVQTVSPDTINSQTPVYIPRRAFGPSNFLQYLSRLYLAFRGEVVYTVLGFSDTVQGLNNPSTESTGVMMGNVTQRVNRPVSEVSDELALLDSYDTAPNCNAVGAGCVYRPVNSPQIPATVSIPYYSTYDHYLTPDKYVDLRAGATHPLWTTTFNTVGAPGARFQANATNNTQYQVYVEAGDAFTMTRPFPPACTAFQIYQGRGITSIAWSPSYSAYKGAP